MRLIDADALKYKNLAEVNGKLTYVLTPEKINSAPTISIDYGVDNGDKTVYANPHGKWIFEKAGNDCTDGYICSECGRSFHTKVPYFSEFNFCPNCGAQMNGGEDHD